MQVKSWIYCCFCSCTSLFHSAHKFHISCPLWLIGLFCHHFLHFFRRLEESTPFSTDIFMCLEMACQPFADWRKFFWYPSLVLQIIRLAYLVAAWKNVFIIMYQKPFCTWTSNPGQFPSLIRIQDTFFPLRKFWGFHTSMHDGQSFLLLFSKMAEIFLFKLSSSCNEFSSLRIKIWDDVLGQLEFNSLPSKWSFGAGLKYTSISINHNFKHCLNFYPRKNWRKKYDARHPYKLSFLNVFLVCKWPQI